VKPQAGASESRQTDASIKLPKSLRNAGYSKNCVNMAGL
jgi:hypothetical protein